MTDRPADHRNVMASRREAPDSLDFYPTPPWAARAGAELIGWLDPPPPMPGRPSDPSSWGRRSWSCWEPACGEGHMAAGLLGPPGPFSEIFVSDIFDHGAGRVLDFLGPQAEAQAGQWDWIITNPPFVQGEAFVRQAQALARRGVAMLCRLAFKETVGRYRLFHGGLGFQPISCAAPYAERVPMQKGVWLPDGGTATAYAWFVWMRPEVEATSTIAEAIGACRRVGAYPEITIPPGAKARLHRQADVQRFCEPAATPLFPEAD